MYLKHIFAKSPLNYHFKKPQASGLHLYPFRWQKGEWTGSSTQFIHALLGGISQIWSLNLSKCLKWQSKDVFPPDSNVHVFTQPPITCSCKKSFNRRHKSNGKGLKVIFFWPIAEGEIAVLFGDTSSAEIPHFTFNDTVDYVCGDIHSACPVVLSPHLRRKLTGSCWASESDIGSCFTIGSEVSVFIPSVALQPAGQSSHVSIKHTVSALLTVLLLVRYGETWPTQKKKYYYGNIIAHVFYI